MKDTASPLQPCNDHMIRSPQAVRVIAAIIPANNNFFMLFFVSCKFR